MKTLSYVFFLLLGILWVPAKSAIVASDLSLAEADILKATAVFHYIAQAGGTSGSNSKESILSTTSTLPDVSTDVTHSFPETLGLQVDDVGNLAASLGSGSTLELPIVDSYNAILIQVYNTNTFNTGASFIGAVINGAPIRDLFADKGTSVYKDQILIHLNGQDEWTLSGDISFDPFFSTGSNNRVEVWGVTVPEPTTPFLCCAFFVISLLFRSRNFSGN